MNTKGGTQCRSRKGECTNLSFQTLKACQISADSVFGALLPVECPCSSVVPCLRPC